MIQNDEDAVGNRHHCFLLAASSRNATILSCQIVLLGMGNGPNDFRQDGFQMRIAWSDGGTEDLASTRVCSLGTRQPKRRDVWHWESDSYPCQSPPGWQRQRSPG